MLNLSHVLSNPGITEGQGVRALSWKQVGLPVCLTEPLGEVDRIQRLLWIAIALHRLATVLCSSINQ